MFFLYVVTSSVRGRRLVTASYLFKAMRIPVSLALCVISGVSAYLIYRNNKREKSGEIFLSQS